MVVGGGDGWRWIGVLACVVCFLGASSGRRGGYVDNWVGEIPCMIWTNAFISLLVVCD